MPQTIVKTESQGDTPTESDPYAAAAAALEQAQRALSTARGQPLIATIPVAEAEQQLDDLRSRIVELEDDVDRYRRSLENLSGAVKERDDARTKVESKVREMADLKQSHEKDRAELAASIKEEREGLQRERDDLTKEHERLDADRVALEAEKKTILEIRTFIAQKLQSMDQLALPNPVPQAPEPQAATPMATTPFALHSTPDLHAAMSMYKSIFASRASATATSDAAVSSLILPRRRPAHESAMEANAESAHPPKRQRTESLASTSTAIGTARLPPRPRQVAHRPSTRSGVQLPDEKCTALALRAKIPIPFKVRTPMTGNPFASPSRGHAPRARMA
ncbi:hypothetical protein B0H11DRAFT_2385972 [Mycena galericulata]|nr:hypothetical protein B0H11DRAFT_2385972 [Mycena galericulata]